MPAGVGEDRVDRLVAQLVDVTRAPVVARAARDARVEHALDRRVRHRAEHVDGGAEVAQRPQVVLGAAVGVEVEAGDREDRRALTTSGGTNGSGGA